MQQSVVDLLAFLKAPNLMRDVVLLVSGLGSLLFFQFVIGINIVSRLTSLSLGRVETDLLILVVAYLFARLLTMFNDIIFAVIVLFSWIIQHVILNPVPIETQWRLLLSNLRYPHVLKWCKSLLGFQDLSIVSPEDMKNEITAIEMADAVEKSPSIGVEVERNLYHLIVSRVAFSTTVLAGLFFNPYYFLLSAMFLYQIIDSIRVHKHSDYLIYKAIVKSINQKSEKPD